MADYVKTLTQTQKELSDIVADMELLQKNTIHFFSGFQNIYKERATVIQGTIKQAAKRLNSLTHDFDM